MSRFLQAGIVVALLIVVVLASGCSGGSGTSPGPTAGTPGSSQSPAKQPHTIADLYNMNYMWNNVNYYRLAMDARTTDSTNAVDTMLIEFPMTFRDTTYNNTPARELISEIKILDEPMSMDLFYKRPVDPDNPVLLGGNVRAPDPLADTPGTMIEAAVTPEMWTAETSGEFGFSIMNVETPLLGLVPLSYLRTETLNVGGKKIDCSVFTVEKASWKSLNRSALVEVLKSYNINVPESASGSDEDFDIFGDSDYDANAGSTYHAGPNSTMEMKFWYSPQFPAMPLKYTIYVYREQIQSSSFGSDRVIVDTVDETFTIEEFR